jgi:hypothetical protein
MKHGRYHGIDRSVTVLEYLSSVTVLDALFMHRSIDESDLARRKHVPELNALTLQLGLKV